MACNIIVLMWYVFWRSLVVAEGVKGVWVINWAMLGYLLNIDILWECEINVSMLCEVYVDKWTNHLGGQLSEKDNNVQTIHLSKAIFNK